MLGCASRTARRDGWPLYIPLSLSLSLSLSRSPALFRFSDLSIDPLGRPSAFFRNRTGIERGKFEIGKKTVRWVAIKARKKARTPEPARRVSPDLNGRMARPSFILLLSCALCQRFHWVNLPGKRTETFPSIYVSIYLSICLYLSLSPSHIHSARFFSRVPSVCSLQWPPHGRFYGSPAFFTGFQLVNSLHPRPCCCSTVYVPQCLLACLYTHMQ